MFCVSIEDHWCLEYEQQRNKMQRLHHLSFPMRSTWSRVRSGRRATYNGCRNHWTSAFKRKKSHSKTYLSVPYSSNFNNMKTVMRGDTWRWLLLKFCWLLAVGLRVMCCLFLHLYPFLRVVPLHDICRVERLDGKRKELTGVVGCPNKILAPSVRRSCNSTPSSIWLFRG